MKGGDATAALKGRFRVLYEDERIVAVEKPAGLLSVPAPGKAGRSLEEIMAPLLLSRGLKYRLYPCHRLDVETSGVILFAKGRAARSAITDLFRHRKVEKTYIALVQGQPAREEGILTRKLEGRSARTEYQVRERRGLYSIVEVRPVTGRKNQIRLHFKAAGHPLVGETRFAFRRDFPLPVRRLMLHAGGLGFIDPWTGEARQILSALPGDMQNFLEKYPD